HLLFCPLSAHHRHLPSFPTRRSSDLDRLSHRVVRGDAEIGLQPREFRLLEYLMKHAGQVVTRTMLLENVWDYHFDPQTNVIDVQDRKSTRLNSSHRTISYAVFCLKKK